jgi:hypothetical protein
VHNSRRRREAVHVRGIAPKANAGPSVGRKLERGRI